MRFVTERKEIRMYRVWGCGGCEDGTLILATENLGEAVEAAYANEDKYECGCYIDDEKGVQYEW